MADENADKPETETKKPEAPKGAAKEAKAAGVQAVFALHKVVYGKGETAVSNSIFVPTSAKERAELIKIGAVREPDETELLIAKAQAESAAAGDNPLG